MTIIEDDLGYAFDEPAERPSRAAQLYGKIIGRLRRYAAAVQQQRLLRQLPDRTLIDIGIDPSTVRDGYPAITRTGVRGIIANPMRW